MFACALIFDAAKILTHESHIISSRALRLPLGSVLLLSAPFSGAAYIFLRTILGGGGVEDC